MLATRTEFFSNWVIYWILQMAAQCFIKEGWQRRYQAHPPLAVALLVCILVCVCVQSAHTLSLWVCSVHTRSPYQLLATECLEYLFSIRITISTQFTKIRYVSKLSVCYFHAFFFILKSRWKKEILCTYI